MSLCSEYSRWSQSNILQLYQGVTSHDTIWTGVTRALVIINTQPSTIGVQKPYSQFLSVQLSVADNIFMDIHGIGVSKLVGPVNVKSVYRGENSVQACSSKFQAVNIEKT